VSSCKVDDLNIETSVTWVSHNVDGVNISPNVDGVNMFRKTCFVRTKQAKKSADPPAYHHGDLRRALIEAGLALGTEEQDRPFW
jgi:hypothetical protein